jgi:hypothetical protein
MQSKNRSWKTFLLLAAGALSLLPTSAIAQDAGGKFVLPREVHWGTVTLAAGPYSYSVGLGPSQTVFLRKASGSGVIVMATTVSMADPLATPRIVLQQQNGEWFVTSMTLGGSGEDLHFSLPSKRSEIARTAESRAKLASLSKP